MTRDVHSPRNDISSESSKSELLNSLSWVSASIPLFFVCLRYYVRLYVRPMFGADDALAAVATAILIGYAIAVTIATSHGLGKHIEVVKDDPSRLTKVLLVCQICQTLAIMACTLGKTSFGLTLLRIVVQRWIVYSLWFILITMNLVNVLAAIFVFMQCKDPRALWNSNVNSDCWPASTFTNFSLFVGAYSGMQDFVFVTFACLVVSKLRMKKREKLGVAVAMSLGSFAGVASIIKTIHLVSLSQKLDFTWNLPTLFWWAALEDGLTILAACIPTLGPLLKSSRRQNVGHSLVTIGQLNNRGSENPKSRWTERFGTRDCGYNTCDGESIERIVGGSEINQKD